MHRISPPLTPPGVVPKPLGAVHFEKIEYGRLGVWNAPFVGHRTGFTQRTAIAVELFF